MSRRDYVVIPTGFAVAYRTARGEYVAVSEHLLPSSAEQECRQLNAQVAADEADTIRLIAAGMPQRRTSRVFEAEA